KPKSQSPGSGERRASYPQGIAPWSAKERCTPASTRTRPIPQQVIEAWRAAVRRRSRQWNYPQGIALLEATGIHFTALQAHSLAGEQVAQPLDVLLGDFWRHRLALWLG